MDKPTALALFIRELGIKRTDLSQSTVYIVGDMGIKTLQYKYIWTVSGAFSIELMFDIDKVNDGWDYYHKQSFDWSDKESYRAIISDYKRLFEPLTNEGLTLMASILYLHNEMNLDGWQLRRQLQLLAPSYNYKDVDKGMDLFEHYQNEYALLRS